VFKGEKMESSAYILGMMGFIMAMICLRDLRKTKKILSKYVNDEDKQLLLTREKPKKKLIYVAIAIWILIFAGLLIFMHIK
jgi:hypothetical protein